jgi:hypothetical protein
MKLKFIGDIAKLKKCVLRTGVSGKWRELENGKMQFFSNRRNFIGA